MGFLSFVLVSVNIALLAWVTRDAKKRGANAVSWGVAVLFFGVPAWILWLMKRPVPFEAAGANKSSSLAVPVSDGTNAPRPDTVSPGEVKSVKVRNHVLIVACFAFGGLCGWMAYNLGVPAGIAVLIGLVMTGVVNIFFQADTDITAIFRCRECGFPIAELFKGSWRDPRTTRFDPSLDPDLCERCPQCDVCLREQTSARSEARTRKTGVGRRQVAADAQQSPIRPPREEVRARELRYGQKVLVGCSIGASGVGIYGLVLASVL